MLLIEAYYKTIKVGDMKDGLRTEKEDAASQAIPSNIILINHLVARRMLEELERVLNGQEGDIDINVSVNGLNALHMACELGYVEVSKAIVTTWCRCIYC